MAPESLHILIPIYNGFNTLDVNGPLDVLCNFALRTDEKPPPFKITITGNDELPAPTEQKTPGAQTAKDKHPVNGKSQKEYATKAYEFVTVRPDCNFERAIEMIKEGSIDILLVPGCGPGAADAFFNQAAAQKYIKTGTEDPLLSVIREFQNYDNKGSQKWMVSICTGALLAAPAGYFEGRDCTTHFGALNDLLDIGYWWNVIPKSVTRQRWIDGGIMKAKEGNEKDTRILSSGGISCGIDASLWLVQQILGTEKAVAVAQMMDYRWIAQTVTSANVTPMPY